MGRNIECRTDNRIPLVVLGVQAIEHQTKALEERKRTSAVGDHERSLEPEIPEWLQPIHGRIDEGIFKIDIRISVDVAIPPPALPDPN